MENKLTVFNYNNNEVRVIEQNGESWFVGKDVAEALGYERTRDALRAHVDKEDKLTRRITAPSNGGYSDVILINEPGVYSLIFSSKLPSAKEFKRWVTHEVLPDIRKHGMYLTDKVQEIAANDPEKFNKLLAAYTEEKAKVKALEAKMQEDAPFATLGRVVLALPGSVPVADAAQFLTQHGIPIGRNKLYEYGREQNLLSKQKGRWNKPTQKGIEQGIVNLELDQNGEYKLSTRTMITAAGLKDLFNTFFENEYPLAALLENADEKQETE